MKGICVDWLVIRGLSSDLLVAPKPITVIRMIFMVIAVSIYSSAGASGLASDLVEQSKKATRSGEQIPIELLDKYFKIGASELAIYDLLKGEGLSVKVINKNLCDVSSDHTLYVPVRLDTSIVGYRKAKIFICVSGDGKVTGVFGSFISVYS